MCYVLNIEIDGGNDIAAIYRINFFFFVHRYPDASGDPPHQAFARFSVDVFVIHPLKAYRLNRRQLIANGTPGQIEERINTVIMSHSNEPAPVLSPSENGETFKLFELVKDHVSFHQKIAFPDRKSTRLNSSH